MYDPLVADLLEEMLEAATKVESRCAQCETMDDLLDQEGQILLDSICMQLIAIGEAVKKVHALTDKALLSRYTNINWKAIAAMRDVLAHHYFDLNAETVFGVCQEEITPLKETLETILEQLE
jgi:uncharacterized protein with HEPN domain